MANKNDSRRTIAQVLGFLRPYRLLVALSLLFAFITVALTLYLPILIGDAVDFIIGPGEVYFDRIASLFGLMGAVILCNALSQWLMHVCNNHITYRVSMDIRSRAFAQVERLPLSYLDAHPYGEIISRIVADVDQLSDGLLMGFTQLFTGVMTIAGTLLFMLRINLKIALVVILITPVSLLVANFIANRTYAMFKLQSETRGELTAHVDEMIGGQKVVQAFGRQAQSQAVFDGINQKLQACSLRATFFSSITNPATRFVNGLVYAGVAIVGAMVAMGGGITVGRLSTFLSYANQYTKPFNEISGVVTELQNALSCAARVFALIDQQPQVPDAPDARVLENPRGAVELSHVDFSYKPDQRLIEDLNLSVEPGQRIAIVGPTGCGKTTIINLLMRFYDVNSGSIQVDGDDVRDITRGSLRQNYGMVLQETWLRTGTIRENLLFGHPEATEEEMIAAAKAAYAHSFIQRMPQGYDTVITEDGGNLSHGQKQLLCIARVMLALPPMLILDEATSSIDTRTEQKVQRAFARMMEGRTSFIVAHRLSTIQNADRILVMKDGHIMEQGTHRELLEKQGFYAHLYNSGLAPAGMPGPGAG